MCLAVEVALNVVVGKQQSIRSNHVDAALDRMPVYFMNKTLPYL